MDVSQPNVDAEAASLDLCHRTLSKMSCDLTRLIYLASLRDYNTGRYHHAGLAARFPEEAVGVALASTHRRIFWNLASSSLEELVEQLELYIAATREQPSELLVAWQKLEPYRIAIPTDIDACACALLLSNIKLALAIAECRSRPAGGGR